MKESELLNPRMIISDSDFSNGGSTCIDTSYNILESLAVKNDDRTTLPSSNSWSCQQTSANNAYNVVPSTGNVNNNNKTYTYAVVPVAEYEKSDDLLSLLFKAERECFKNKKKNPQGVKIHYDLKIIYQLYEQIKNKTYKPSPGLCFVISQPKPREVFAAPYKDRIIHHLVAPFMYDVAEKVHLENGNICHGNRKNFSVLTAAKQIQQNMKKYKNGFVATMDVQGFFMSIPRQLSFDIFKSLCKQYPPDNYSPEIIELLLPLIKKLFLHDPTFECSRNSPLSEWDKIPVEKSLFNKKGIGLPIGNFYSQIMANLILSIWGSAIQKLKLDCAVTQFVDDMCIVSKDAKTMNIIRKESFNVLNSIGLKLHEKKFYIQEIQKGAKFCGRVIFKDRLYLINRTINEFFISIDKYLKFINLSNAKKLLTTFNSYIGFLCHCNNFKIQEKAYIKILNSKYNKYLYFQIKNNKIICKLKDKYKLKNNYKNNIINIIEEQKKYEKLYSKYKCCA